MLCAQSQGKTVATIPTRLMPNANYIWHFISEVIYFCISFSIWKYAWQIVCSIVSLFLAKQFTYWIDCPANREYRSLNLTFSEYTLFLINQQNPVHIYRSQVKAWGVRQRVVKLGCFLKLSPHNADHQKVGNVYHQRWISENVHYIRLHNRTTTEPILALKPRGDITRNPKQGYQWPQ